MRKGTVRTTHNTRLELSVLSMRTSLLLGKSGLACLVGCRYPSILGLV